MRDSNPIRLRLVVRRHALPEVRVVFPVQLDTDPTIANLLEQINEVIPLESNDWGLEDYAVELRDFSGQGFDCLHFQQVSLVLKNDEEVFIRPLDTGDRRKRRLSGRYQISTDGRRLIDGVAFGRPRLKLPRDRPAVDIPPLKRRRLTYEAEEGGEEEEPRLLITEHGEEDRDSGRVRKRARFADIDSDGSNGEEEEDGDFNDEDIRGSDDGEEDLDLDENLDDSELEDELRDLQADNEQLGDKEVSEPDITNKASEPAASGQTPELDLETLDKIAALRAAFPTAEFDACERALALHGGNTESAYNKLRAGHQPLMSLRAMLARPIPPLSNSQVGAYDDDESEAESVASVVKHYDQHGFPSGSILDGTAAAQTVEAMRRSGLSVKPPVHTKFDDDGQAQPDAAPSRTSADEEDNASESDGESDNESDGESDSEDESESENQSDNDDESNSDEDSDSDSGPEVASSKRPKTPGGASLSLAKGSAVSEDDESEEEEDDSDGSVGSESDSSDQAETSDSDEDSDSDDSRGNSSSDNASSSDSDDDDDSALGHATEESDAHGSDYGSANSDDSDESDGSDSSSEDDSSDGSVKIPAKAPSVPKEATTTMQASARGTKSVTLEKPEPRQPVPPGQGKTATQKRNARRRVARMAKNAAARGVSPPANGLGVPVATESRGLLDSIVAKKAALLQRLNLVQDMSSQAAVDAGHGKDQEATPSQAPEAENLVPDAQSSKVDAESDRAVESRGTHPQHSEDKQEIQEDPEAWRDKIIYRAVECCQDGIELSEPPFPFVQRWDPQQQYFHRDKNKRGGRSKRKQRDQEEYLDESSAKRRRHDEDSLGYEGDDGYGESYTDYYDTTGYEETTLNYDDEPQKAQEEPEQAPSQVDEEDDMPALPEDVSALPVLNPGEAVTGMILTWKQLLLSKATNWQPQVSALTGKVVDVLDDSTLEVRLARRDWNLDRNEKVYDDEGNRVYDKFELPGMDDEGDEACEQGYRTLDIADMIEPRVLQPAPEGVSATTQGAQSQPEDRVPDASQEEETEMPDDHDIPATSNEASLEGESVDANQMDVDPQCGVGQSIVPETPVAPELVDTTISEDRRHEISLLINDAGFRKDVDPSVTDNAGPDLSSPSRQLEEMSHDATFAMSEASDAQRHSSPQLPSQVTSNNIDSQPILLEPFHGFSDATSEPQERRRVAYPQLDLPPSETASLHSGRQVDPDFSIELGDDAFHELNDPAMVSRSTLGRRSEDAREPPSEHLTEDSGADSDGSASDSSLPSLSDLWKSTSSTNGSKSPSKRAVMSAIQSRKPEVPRDLDYEATMKRLDDATDDSEDDNKAHVSKLVQKLVDKPIERPTSKKPAQKKGVLRSSSAPQVKTEPGLPTPDRAGRASSGRTVRANSSPFVIPEGSQIVNLVTSSPEPELEEHYAEDSIDPTYNEPSLPAGAGWVKKARARRGVSVPAFSAARDAVPKRFASSQAKQAGADKRSTAALSSLLRTKKKALSNMY